MQIDNSSFLGVPVDSMSSFQSPISPAELLLALHHIDTTKCDLKTVIKGKELL